MNDLIRRLCAVCSDPVDPETAHSLHEDECPKSHCSRDPHIVCRCDAVVHPDCCPEPQCQDIGTGLTVVVTARFAVAPWFSKDQAHELGQSIVEYLTQTDRPLHADYGPDPESWYGEDTAYICAVSADVRAVHQSVPDPAAVLWGHGERCKRCHHLEHEEGNACVAEDCDCPCHVAYVPVDQLLGSRS
jgi:hypothetical protein